MKEKFENVLFLKGDIFESKMQTIVNTVNCLGVMGAGLALQFKQKYPDLFNWYVELCKKKKISVGKPVLWKGERWVLNFPTKNDWKKPSKLEWIEDGLKFFCENYKEWGIESIAFPGLGCDLGGLTWIDVKKIMLKHLSKIDIPVEIYLPKLTPTEKALDSLFDYLYEIYKDELVSISVIRKFFPETDGWTDLKKAEKIRVLIVFKSLRREDVNIKLDKKINSFLQISVLNQSDFHVIKQFEENLQNNKNSLL